MRLSGSVLIFILVIFIIHGCSSNSTGPGDPGNPQGSPGTISMTINGSAWTSTTASADTSVDSGIIRALGIAATRSPVFDVFSFGIGDVAGITEKTYTQSPGSTFIISGGYVHPTDTTLNSFIDFNSSSATVTISSLNLAARHVSGTFSMDLFKQAGGTAIEIRNGVFTEVPLIQQ